MVKIVESSRDAWQRLPRILPAEVKADYLRVVIASGFKHIDAVSFLAKADVPQMADSERVLDYLDPPDDVEIIGLVTDPQGAERAIKTGSIATLAFPYSISPNFLRRSQDQTPEESLEALEAIGTLAFKAGLDLVAYLTMAFGNTDGDAWSIEEVIDACDLLVDCGVNQIVLADTAGLATPKLLSDLLADVVTVQDRIKIGVHLHATPGNAEALMRAAYSAGCRRFDSSIGGLGGCPPANNTLITNLPTELLIRVLKDLGAELPDLRPLDGLISASAAIDKRFSAPTQ